jgi:hypothetical protein
MPMQIEELARAIVNEYSYASPGSETALIQIAAEVKNLEKTLVQRDGRFFVAVEVENG